MSLLSTSVALVAGSLAASAVALSCGSGPTEAPKTPENPLTSPLRPEDGVYGVAPTTATERKKPAQESKVRTPSRPFAEDKRLMDEEAKDAGPPETDPMNGQFTLEQATAGLAGTGPLTAAIKTNKGDMKCKLFDDKAPVAVANFVGLARGTRPFKEKGQWITRPAYDGTTFHRIIKGFMIQGGDPQGTGRGEPGYTFKDELWGGKHDRAGLLCMANRGPDTNGMQFFITDAASAHLDTSYTIFGECSPVSVVHTIASVPVDSTDHPAQPVTITKVEISRGGAASGAAGAGGAALPTPPKAPAAPPPPPLTPIKQ